MKKITILFAAVVLGISLMLAPAANANTPQGAKLGNYVGSKVQVTCMNGSVHTIASKSSGSKSYLASGYCLNGIKSFRSLYDTRCIYRTYNGGPQTLWRVYKNSWYGVGKYDSISVYAVSKCPGTPWFKGHK